MPPRDGALALAAVASLIAVSATSAARFAMFGPAMPSWTYSTQLSRDMLSFMLQPPPEGRLRAAFSSASAAYWPALGRLLLRPAQNHHAQTLAIPACTLDDDAADDAQMMERAGVWAPGLAAVARASRGLELPAECVFASPDADADADASDAPRPHDHRAILHFHGGAYVTGSLDSYRGLHARLSEATGLRVYGFEYRLAPAAQYPTQLYDALCAFRHLRALGYAEEDIVFSGDSAGGNLALALWQLLRPRIRGLVLLSPRVDVTSARPSWRAFAGIDILPPYDIASPASSLRKLLAPPGAALTPDVLALLADPYIAPVRANLTGLPPTLVQVGTAEVMYDDICAFVARAEDHARAAPPHARNPIVLQHYPDMFHVFQAVPMAAPAVDRAWREIGAFVRALP
ncbi:hypothetical protein H4R18_002976 [Coemansia javaensis]|uniref:Alpha/beta hydrolase fold-3 domain-containing protein n=1 Tax=Coemansia javaensis TaxID=2761396 RepID=A0A9W8H9D2_9FUNG|nr:hypothetical protein H4R18_002976 [Coemansia javaensis]